MKDLYATDLSELFVFNSKQSAEKALLKKIKSLTSSYGELIKHGEASGGSTGDYIRRQGIPNGYSLITMYGDYRELNSKGNPVNRDTIVRALYKNKTNKKTMADALEKYRSALKKYRKENPNVPFKTAQKRVSAEMKSGAISGHKKRKKGPGATTHKKAMGDPKCKRIATRPVKITGTRKISGVAKGEQLLRKIERLEIKRREARAMELKDIIQVEINKLHDQLDALRGHHKRRSA